MPSAPAKVLAPKAPPSQDRKSRAGASSTKNIEEKNTRSAVSKKAKVSGASSKKKDTRPALPKKIKGPGIIQVIQDEKKRYRRERAILKSTPEEPIPTKQEFSALQQQSEGVSDKATTISLDKQAKLARRTAALARAKAKKEQGDLEEGGAVDEPVVDEPTHEPRASSTSVDSLAVRRAQYHRKEFRGLKTQHKGQCAASVLQCLANLPKVAKVYKDKDSDCVRSEQDLDDSDLFGIHEDM